MASVSVRPGVCIEGIPFIIQQVGDISFGTGSKKDMQAVAKVSRKLVVYAMALLLCGAAWTSAHAEIAILMEEPYGTFGHMNPTGHAAVYMNHICATGPTELRPCKPGEAGVVISRYHRVAGDDWIAIPLIPYLYAVEKPSEIPATATPELEVQVRDAYRRAHLRDVAPDGPDGAMPGGDWTQLVGASYDRKIFGLNMRTSAEQDAAFIALFNDRSNKGRFNLIYRNCAEVDREVWQEASRSRRDAVCGSAGARHHPAQPPYRRCDRSAGEVEEVHHPALYHRAGGHRWHRRHLRHQRPLHLPKRRARAEWCQAGEDGDERRKCKDRTDSGSSAGRTSCGCRSAGWAYDAALRKNTGCDCACDGTSSSIQLMMGLREIHSRNA